MIKRGGGYEKKPYIFHILTDKIENQSEQKLNELEKNLNLKYPCEIQIHTMSDEDFQGKGKWKGSFVANFILKFDEVLSDEVDKALCLDVDMFVFTDLRELFELDLKDKIAAVVSWEKYRGSKKFNSGLVLFNVKAYKKLNLHEQALNYILKNNPKCPDQDALNAVLKDKVYLLPHIYNLFPTHKNLTYGHFKNESEMAEYKLTRKEYENLLQSAKIVHFIECSKPWECQFKPIKGKICLSVFRDSWWDNALKTPVFKEELLKLYQNLKEEETKVLILNLEQGNFEIPKYFKNQIEYKLGFAIIKYAQIKGGFLKLPFVLAKISLKYKIAKTIYKFLSFYDPKLKINDPEFILKNNENEWFLDILKEHLSYKFGVAFIKAYKTWYKGGFIKFYFEAKKLEREFKKNKIKNFTKFKKLKLT